MAKIAVLGTGLLGSGFVESLLGQGHEVHIWNRTTSKAEPLEAAGAIVHGDPAQAVSGVDRVHLVLSEDAAVDSVVAALQPGLAAEVPVLDHSTTRPARTKARYDALRKQGVRYIHAPVFMSPNDARKASGIMLFAGSQEDHDSLHDALATMTGKVWYTGPRRDLAAFYKLAGNALILGISGLMGDILSMGFEQGLDAGEVLALFDGFQPGAALPVFARRVATAGDRPASFELEMARKDVALMVEAGGQRAMTVLPAVLQAMQGAIAEGHGKQDFAIYARPDR